MDKWIYENDEENSMRYVLGTIGKNPVLCIGINPSTAKPKCLDKTAAKVEKIALNNGYDSWIMFNVYPKIATKFENLHSLGSNNIHLKNFNVIKKYLENVKNATVWAAFGDKIYGRDYLVPYFNDIYNGIKGNNLVWVTTGINKSGSPKHPLYQKNNSTLKVFDMETYMESLQKKFV